MVAGSYRSSFLALKLLQSGSVIRCILPFDGSCSFYIRCREFGLLLLVLY